MDLGTRVERRESEELVDAVVSPVDALALVRDEESGDVTVLSLVDTDCKPLVLCGTAAVIWDELDGERSLRLVVSSLASEYGLDELVIGEQVLTFVTQLLDARLLQKRNSEAITA